MVVSARPVMELLRIALKAVEAVEEEEVSGLPPGVKLARRSVKHAAQKPVTGPSG